MTLSRPVSLILLALLFCSFSPENRARNELARPPYLKPGDTIGIVSPASKLRLKSDTTKVRQQFEAMGLNVKFGRHFFCQGEPVFAGTDEQRAEDLQAMIDDDAVKAVIAYRGGYGSVRLLDRLDLSKLHNRPKWIVGYSDITMLHLALQKEGIESIHGAMPVDFRNDTIDLSAGSLRQALFGEMQRIDLPPHPLNLLGEATGQLTGGNLAVLCSAAATPVDMNPDEPSVLLLEEIGERAYSLDRMLQSLKQSGKLQKFKAILVGHFTKITEAEYFTPSGDIYELIHTYIAPLGIPVVFGFPSGHEAPNFSVYMGRHVTVRVDDAGASVSF